MARDNGNPLHQSDLGFARRRNARVLCEMVYGVNFDFVSGSPGYVGPLYILEGDVLTGDPPILIARPSGPGTGLQVL